MKQELKNDKLCVSLFNQLYGLHSKNHVLLNISMINSIVSKPRTVG
jgi:hypothetical protein